MSRLFAIKLYFYLKINFVYKFFPTLILSFFKHDDQYGILNILNLTTINTESPSGVLYIL